MLDAAVKALSQILSPPMRSILWRSIGLALVLIVVLALGLQRLLSWLATSGEAWAFDFEISAAFADVYLQGTAVIGPQSHPFQGAVVVGADERLIGLEEDSRAVAGDRRQIGAVGARPACRDQRRRAARPLEDVLRSAVSLLAHWDPEAADGSHDSMSDRAAPRGSSTCRGGPTRS